MSDYLKQIGRKILKGNFIKRNEPLHNNLSHVWASTRWTWRHQARIYLVYGINKCFTLYRHF